MTVNRRFIFKFLDPKVIKFLLSGILNTVFGYSVYAVLLYVEVPYLIALFVATVVGVIFNYFSFGSIVFKTNHTWFAFGKFVIAYIGIYSVNAIFLSILTQQLLLNPYWGQGICIPLSVGLSWLLMHFWVYKKDRGYVPEKIN